MIPIGYMSKRVSKRPDYLRAPSVVDIYSVSDCIREDFADYTVWWKHNGYWLFDSPDVIRNAAQEHGIDLVGTSFFYYEAYENEFDGKNWNPYQPNFVVNVIQPASKQLEGFDVVTNTRGCSPLSCNSLAEQIPTNSHCLLANFEKAYAKINAGEFNNSEPSPYRIFSVYSTDWPQ